jgi:uncharacterized protein YwgA
MKGLFLLSREGPGELRNLYAFKPYDYGPFDKAVYLDIEELTGEGLTRSEGVPYSSRKVYRLTEVGEARAESIRRGMDLPALKAIDGTKRLVTGMSFNQLLRYVYERHPDMATRSRFDG